MESEVKSTHQRRLKIALVGSSGGHLSHLLALEEWWRRHERFWVTFKKTDAVSALTKESVYWCHFPTNRNLLNLLRNSILAWRVMIREKPDVVVSSGAAVAVPFFMLAKIMRKRTVYIEVFDRIDSATLTGRIVYKMTDKFLVQWNEQLQLYPKAENVGELL